MKTRNALSLILLVTGLTAYGQTSYQDADLASLPLDQLYVSEGLGSPRPSFLAAPKPEPQEEWPAENQPTGPRTMTQMIEVPIPEPVAQPIALADSRIIDAGTDAPNLVSVDGAQSPAIVFEGEDGKPLKPKTAPPSDPGKLLKQKRYRELEPIMMETRDSALAAAVGWSYYNDDSFRNASKWFEQAIVWNENNYEAAYGLALVLTRQGKYDKAEQMVRWRMREYPKMENVMGDILTARAVSAYQDKNYQKSRELFEEVERYRPLSRSEKIVQAWNTFHSGMTPQAATEFEKLYLAKPDKFAASGVYAACAREENWKRIEQISREHGGPLASMYREYLGSRYYDRGLYANALATSPEKFPELKGYTSPRSNASGRFRYKTGDSGTSELQEIRATAGGVLYADDVNRLGVEIGVSNLEAGGLPKASLVGQAPLDRAERVYQSSPVTSYRSLVDMRLSYEREGEFTPHVEIGFSPTGGAVSPTVVGSIGLRNAQDWGDWEFSFYRESVKQSILSYTGMKDPYTGKKWGRVSESGASLSGFANIQDGWSMFGLLSAGALDGKGVASNSHTRLIFSLNKLIEHPDFEYITVGPSFAFEHYAKNLSHFTYGHGGYFSPDYLLQGTFGAQFLTKQARPLLVKGGLQLGLQSYSEATAPIFPLDPPSPTYRENEDETFIAMAEVTGLFQLSAQWALGASLSYNRTANYSEFNAGIFLKYFFEPRAGLFATDLADL